MQASTYYLSAELVEPKMESKLLRKSTRQRSEGFNYLRTYYGGIQQPEKNLAGSLKYIWKMSYRYHYDLCAQGEREK